MQPANSGIFAHYFRDLPDPRRSPSCRHAFLDILVLAFCAAVSGQFAWTDIELYATIHLDWFKTFLQLPNGVPSHDTFRYVFSRLDPQAFQRCFTAWITALSTEADLRHVAIDGKSLRGSADPANGKAPLHLVSAWASHDRLTLGQVATAEKSNEITAIPKLLEILSLKGALVTIDAMGCQKEIAGQIREQEGHYLLGLKGNHPGLLEEVEQAVLSQLEQGKVGKADCLETVEQSHGRTEKRTYTRITDLSQVQEKEAWRDLAAVVMAMSERTAKGKTSTEVRYFLTSYEGAVAELAEVIRGHWGIENECHWVLDVTFGEDRSRKRVEHGAENIGWLRRMALSVLRNDPTPKLNMKQKSLKALCDHDFLLQLLLPNKGSQMGT
jgi:predicted transposase YbfD/YdcC